MDVVVWLRSLGLGKYEAAFRENEIEETFSDGGPTQVAAHHGLAREGVYWGTRQPDT
jgi:hypothetical protein